MSHHTLEIDSEWDNRGSSNKGGEEDGGGWGRSGILGDSWTYYRGTKEEGYFAKDIDNKEGI